MKSDRVRRDFETRVIRLQISPTLSRKRRLVKTAIREPEWAGTSAAACHVIARAP